MRENAAKNNDFLKEKMEKVAKKDDFLWKKNEGKGLYRNVNRATFPSYKLHPTPPRTGAKAVATKPQRQSSFRSGATFPNREFSYAEFPYK